jgi:surface antigen
MTASRTRLSKTGRTAVALALIAAVALPLTGCETIQRETGLNRSTQWGAAGGAAFGGIVAALANASPAGIAASVILGGLAGGYIGDHLGREDAARHARTHTAALNGLGAGQSQHWSDKKTGNSGSTTVLKVTAKSGQTCKAYREIVHTGSTTVTKEGKACRSPGGTWQKV